jgi:hypothetical protein
MPLDSQSDEDYNLQVTLPLKIKLLEEAVRTQKRHYERVLAGKDDKILELSTKCRGELFNTDL